MIMPAWISPFPSLTGAFARRPRGPGRCLATFSLYLMVGLADAAMKEHLPVEIDGTRVELEITAESPSGTAPASGWPIALITHGAPGHSTPPSDIGPDSLGGWVRFFSGRGYYAVAVARRGYATSDGPRVGDNGTCAEPKVETYLDEHASDLAAVAQAIGERPEADSSRVVVVGHSAGGVAALALNGRTTGAAAAVSVAGGSFRFEEGAPADNYAVFDGCERYRDATIEAIATIADRGAMPTLWIYSKNDPFFEPEFVGRMAQAWSAAPNSIDPVIEMLPSTGNAHALFLRDEGLEQMRSPIDAFLSDQGLPAQTSDLELALRGCLPIASHPEALGFLANPMHRALAISSAGSEVFAVTDSASLEAARLEALAICAQLTGANCRIIAQDARLFTNRCPTGAQEN